MIVDPSQNDDSMKEPLLGTSSSGNTPQDQPPSYDFATDSGTGSSSPPHSNTYKPLIPTPPSPTSKGPASLPPNVNQPLLLHHGVAGPSYVAQPAPTIYNYVNPLTGEQVASLLPPDHPEMICLQEGRHVPHTQYGLLGILAAIFWFPLGIGLCLLDKRTRCSRCGQVIDEGICG